jgi:phage repressor protein C with HTH and peptisase S24 domain
MNLEPGKLALISAIGDSMSPTIRDGDLLLVDMRQRQVGDDAIYIIRRDSSLVAKRFQRLFDGTVSIKSDNPIYKEEVVPKDAASELNLIGRVVWIGRKA